jgi:hypothetical protein
MMLVVGSLFYDAFSVTRLYSIDDWVNDGELQRMWQEAVMA